MDPQQEHPSYRPQPHQSQPQVPSNVGPAQNYNAPAPQHDYSFIMEPANPFPKRSTFSISAAKGSPIGKIAVGAGIVFAVLVLFVILKSATGSSSASLDMPSLYAVLQDQTELLHLTNPNSAQRPPQGISTTTINSRVTVQLSIQDAQSKLMSYISKNHKKINSKETTLKISSATDKQLTNAGTNGDYDQTYQTILSNQLAIYKQDLKAAYTKNPGKKGRALLNDEYKGAQLLEQQLSSPSS